MEPKQLLERAYQDIAQLKQQLSKARAKDTTQKNVIEQLTNALDSLRKQYDEMLRAGDRVIAEQANKINQLEQEKQELRRQIEDLKKNIA